LSHTTRAVGVFAGRARLALVLQLVACLPRDELDTHSREWGIDAGVGGSAGEAPDPAELADAGGDSSAGGSNGSLSPEPERDAAADAAPLRDGGEFDAGGDAPGPGALDASAGVLRPEADGG
jgi:hypothetical protein